MSYALERQTIETLFSEGWLDDSVSPPVPLTPVYYDGHSANPGDIEEWVALDILSGESAQITIGAPGNNAKRHAGVVALRISTRAGEGSRRARELADRAEAIFVNKTEGNVRFGIPYPAGSAEQNGVWSTWTIWCPFTRDDFNA